MKEKQQMWPVLPTFRQAIERIEPRAKEAPESFLHQFLLLCLDAKAVGLLGPKETRLLVDAYQAWLRLN
jgi:hypothetical protein